MRRLKTLAVAAISAATLIGCQSAANTNVNMNKALNSNSNIAVVVNNNTAVMNSNANSNKSLSRDDYDKTKDTYSKEAKDTGDKIGQGLEDGWLNAKTRAEFTATSDLRGRTINIDVDNAVVTLRGTIASKEQEDKAVSLAKGISGVKDVKNMLKIDPKDSMTNQMVNGNGNTKTTNANMKK